MKSPVFRIVRFALVAAIGLAGGLGARHFFQAGDTGVKESRAWSQEAGGGNPAGRPARSVAGRPGLKTPDPSVYPPFSLAYHAAFAETAAEAIRRDPRAAMKEFAASPKLHTTGCVEIFAELLCLSDPLSAMELEAALPVVFSRILQSYVLPALAARDPEKALKMADDGAFPRIEKKYLYTILGSGAGGSGDLSHLAFFRRTLKDEPLQMALSGFAEQFAATRPEAAAEAAAANPDLARTLLGRAGREFWQKGDLSAAFSCFEGRAEVRGPGMVSAFVMDIAVVPAGALLPAFTRLVELSARDAILMPPNQMERLCNTVRDRLEATAPEQIRAYARIIPEGPLRDVFLQRR